MRTATLWRPDRCRAALASESRTPTRLPARCSCKSASGSDVWKLTAVGGLMPGASATTRAFSRWAGAAAIAALSGLMSVVGHGAAQTPGTRSGTANGRALVERSKCLDCHRIGERGSRLGPSLTDIGNLRSREELRAALLAPDQDVRPEYRSIRVVTRDGTIVGRLLNQDAFTIQLLNADEQLKSYPRSALREQTILSTGLMPSYEGKLTAQEIADVVDYLASLPEGED